MNKVDVYSTHDAKIVDVTLHIEVIEDEHGLSFPLVSALEMAVDALDDIEASLDPAEYELKLFCVIKKKG